MRRWLVDVALAVGAGGITVYRVSVATVTGVDRPPDEWAYLIGVLMALALLARRRWPAGVLALVGGLFLLYHVLEYPGGAPAVPLWVALYSVAVAPRRRAGLVLAGTLLVIDAYSRMLINRVGLLDTTLDSSTILFVSMLLLGEVVRGRRARLALLAADRDRVAELRVSEERMRIARELHDVTAHTLAVVNVQAGVAAEVLDDDPAQARAALENVRRATREAMNELRAAVATIRDGPPPTGEAIADGAPPEPPAPTLDRLPELAASTGAVVVYDGQPRPLSPVVELTAYRIVQEAVANALRHADAQRIDVRLNYRPAGLLLTVRDDGRGASGPPGNGLRGMAERAAGLGGWLRAEPVVRGGFQVQGWLPDCRTDGTTDRRDDEMTR
ncbi:sensor histidine kinase [Micromonospora sonneratiae]|uniref:histidine kinase n=1 Tax=Micromonospora sonneratiae TaxID=1184706 RepID=A0ABW3YA05_9ACTN